MNQNQLPHASQAQLPLPQGLLLVLVRVIHATLSAGSRVVPVAFVGGALCKTDMAQSNERTKRTKCPILAEAAGGELA